MRERGVEVLYVQDLLAEALAASDDARQRLIDLVASEYVVGTGLVDDGPRACLAGLAPDVLAQAPHRRPDGRRVRPRPRPAEGSSLIAAAIDDDSTFVLPPLPNTLFTRDSSCWIYGGVSINPMYWPARRREAYNMAAIYRAHPMFKDQDFDFWYPPLGDDDRFRIEDFGLASLEGGDVEIIGRGTVAIGLSERTTGRMIEQIAPALFAKGAAERVIAAVMTKDRAHMHLDTVFTLLDRDKATAYPKVVDGIRAISLRPGLEARDARRPRGQGLPVARSPTRSASRSSTSSRPAATPTSRSASSGTTATTSSRSSRASSSPTSGTRSRSRRCARPASRSSRSRASSSARDAAAGTA